MREKELISFVVMAYKDQANIPRTIEAITALDDLGQHEIIVVDDGSHDRPVSIVKEIAATSETVRLIELGRTAAVNSRGTGESPRRAGRILLLSMPISSCRRTGSFQLVRRSEKHSAVGGTPVPDGDVAYIYRKFRLAPRFVGNTTTVTDNIGLYLRKVFELVRFA